MRSGIVQGEPKQKSKKRAVRGYVTKLYMSGGKLKITEEVKARGVTFYYKRVCSYDLKCRNRQKRYGETPVPGPVREPYRRRGRPLQPGSVKDTLQGH